MMNYMITLGDFLHWAEKAFIEAQLTFGHGTDNAWDEAVALALPVLHLPPDIAPEIIERVLTLEEQETLSRVANIRIQERIPVPYIIHEAWFAGLKFYVDERVIIPRSPMAELIVNGLHPWVGKRPIQRILDLCTGSACIAIALAYAFPEATIDAIDISEPALVVARKNVVLHACENRVQLWQSDLFSACPPRKYDLIISNPPYVDVEEMACLPVEYQWEPRLALAAGADALTVVKRILKAAPQYLSTTALLLVEVGNAAETLQAQYPHIPFTWLEFERGGEGVFLLTAEDQVWQRAF